MNMHLNDLALLRDEAQRLLRLNIEVLEQMMVKKGVIVPAKEGGRQTFDRTSTPRHIEVLTGELTKLDSMELVIAVVGTMKAGKSTTINAIVGTEVLPNRSSPMTALPTLIRHVLGQIEPVLYFENNQPINALFEKIREHLVGGCTDAALLTRLNADNDMKMLLQNVQNRQAFVQSYQGAINIFSCLKMLNDLVRLSGALGIDFPFSAYGNIKQMPVIAVEFAHLRESGKTHGQFTLLDTPGPNEAGQQHLREMLNEQLQKSSAVLSVIDYEQMGSDADADVRQEIMSRTRDCGERLFTLVNKVDRKNRNGLKKTDVQKFVAENLMNNAVTAANVFPISAELAYLANRAKHEISLYQQLPKEPWVDDFSDKAFGVEVEDGELDDVVKVESAAHKLWKKSGFNDLMQEVILPVHARVELLAIKSAISQSRHYMEKATSYLNNRLVSLSKNLSEIDEKIDELREGLKNIETQEQSIDDLIKKTSSGLNSKMQNSIEGAKKKLDKSVKSLLTPHALGLKQKGDKLVSDDREQMDKALHQLDKRIFEIKEEEFDALKYEIAKIVKTLVGNFESELSVVRVAIKKLNKSFADDSFSVDIKVVNLSFDVPANNLLFEDKIATETEKKTRHVDGDGFWNGFLRFFNSNWGRETRIYEVESFSADINNLQKSVADDIENTFRGYLNEVEIKVMKPLQDEIHSIFDSLKKEVEFIRSDLEQGMSDKALEKDEQNNLRLNLNALLKEFVAVKRDLDDITNDVDRASANVGVVKMGAVA